MKEENKKSPMDMPDYFEQFSTEDLEIMKEKNPAQYALVMERLKNHVVSANTEKSKRITDFDDFF